MKKIKGDLIKLAHENNFDVIAHGCNCFCVQKAGIAKQMKETFGTDTFTLEQRGLKGDYNKLGQIDYAKLFLEDGRWVRYPDEGGEWVTQELIVVNAYTQYELGRNARPVWLISSLMKINHEFKGMKVGLPYISAGIGGLSPTLVEDCIQMYMKECDVTLVEYDGGRTS